MLIREIPLSDIIRSSEMEFSAADPGLLVEKSGLHSFDRFSPIFQS